MQSEPLVSIIVPCYNLSEYLLETLVSIEAQSYPNWECIIVDDGSTDATARVAQQWCGTREKFTYIYKENGGQSSARNLGIRSSSGQYILCVDADDKINPEYIDKCVEVVSKDPQIGIVYCKAEKFCGKKHKAWELPPYSIERMLCSNMIFSCALFHRSHFNQTNGFDENRQNLYEDWDFWLSIIELGYRVHCIDEVLFYYRVRNLSFSNQVRGKVKWQSIFVVVNNHLPLYAKHRDSNALLKISQKLLNNKEFKLGDGFYRTTRKVKNFFKNTFSISKK